MDSTQTNCAGSLNNLENYFNELSISTTSEHSDRLERRSFKLPKNSLTRTDGYAVVGDPNLSVKDHIPTAIFQSIDTLTHNKENNAPPMQPQHVNIVNTYSIKLDQTPNLEFNAGPALYQSIETLQLDGTIPTEVKQPCQRAKAPIQNRSRDITSSSSTDDFPEEIALALTDFESLKDISSKPSLKLRVRKDLLADDDKTDTYSHPTVAFHEDIDYEKDKDELISLGLLTNFSSSEEMVNSIPMKPILKRNEFDDTHANDKDDGIEEATGGDVHCQKKQIPFENRFTKMKRHTYKHTYFDSDGNKVESDDQTSGDASSQSKGKYSDRYPSKYEKKKLNRNKKV